MHMGHAARPSRAINTLPAVLVLAAKRLATIAIAATCSGLLQMSACVVPNPNGVPEEGACAELARGRSSPVGARRHSTCLPLPTARGPDGSFLVTAAGPSKRDPSQAYASLPRLQVGRCTIRRERLEDLTIERFEREFVARGQPVLLEGAVPQLRWRASARWVGGRATATCKSTRQITEF